MDFKKSILIIGLILLLAATVNACQVSISDFENFVRADGDFDSSISALRNQYIDIKVNFTIDSVTGSDCPSNLSVKSVITKYNNDTGNWDNVETTISKTSELIEDPEPISLTWSNEFNTGASSRYTRFKVESKIFQSSTQIDDSVEAFVDVTNDTCEGINIVANDISIDEGISSTRTFRVENNTNKEFRISTLDLIFTNALIRSGSTNYDNSVPAYSDAPITVSLDAGYVSTNTRTTGTLKVSGYLDDQYCSQSTLGTKNFTITIQNTGSSDSGSGSYYDSYGTSAYCSDITINADSFSMNENSDSKFAISAKNNSTKRFEILQVSTTSTGVELSNYYNERYIFPGQVSDIILQAKSPNVTSDRIFTNTLKVRGQFSDGRSCSFDNIGAKTFTISVSDQTSTTPGCGLFSMNVPDNISVQTYGVLPFTINNGTNRKVDVFIEGTAEVTPTIISLPAKSSISRSADVKLTNPSGEIIFRGVIEGCSTVTERVLVTNTAIGNLSAVGMNATVETDESGNTTLNVEVNNTSNNTFEGLLQIQAPSGWSALSRAATINPGQNVFKIILAKADNAQAGSGKVTFTSNGQEISSSFSLLGEGSLAGLFAFGISEGAIGLVLLVIIILVVIAAVLVLKKEIEAAPAQENQAWVEKK